MGAVDTKQKTPRFVNTQVPMKPSFPDGRLSLHPHTLLGWGGGAHTCVCFLCIFPLVTHFADLRCVLSSFLPLTFLTHLGQKGYTREPTVPTCLPRLLSENTALGYLGEFVETTL